MHPKAGLSAFTGFSRVTDIKAGHGWREEVISWEGALG